MYILHLMLSLELVFYLFTYLKLTLFVDVNNTSVILEIRMKWPMLLSSKLYKCSVKRQKIVHKYLLQTFSSRCSFFCAVDSIDKWKGRQKWRKIRKILRNEIQKSIVTFLLMHLKCAYFCIRWHLSFPYSANV